MDNPGTHLEKAGLQKKLVLLAALFTGLYCLILLPLFYIQIIRAAHSQVSLFGQSLSLQLAEQVRQPLLSEDAISLQVILDNLVNHAPLVKRAAVLTPDERIFAESKIASLTENTLIHGTFTRPLSLSNSPGWQVQIALDPNPTRAKLLTIYWSVSSLGLLLCMALLYGAQRIGKNIALRLEQLRDCLPGDDSISALDEISLLEKRIKPLLIKAPTNQSTDHVRENTQSCCLAVRCTNLPQLQAHLTRANFERLLKRFDDILSCTSDLFKGLRLSGTKNCVYLQFSTQDNDENYILRAISCHLALVELQQEQASDAGTGLVLSSALALSPEWDNDASRFIQDTLTEQALDKLASTSTLADAWQLLIDDATKTKIPAEAGIYCEELAGATENSKEQFLFADLGVEQQALFERQLAYLRNQLSENEQAHWQQPSADNPLISAVAS